MKHKFKTDKVEITTLKFKVRFFANMFKVIAQIGILASGRKLKEKCCKNNSFK